MKTWIKLTGVALAAAALTLTAPIASVAVAQDLGAAVSEAASAVESVTMEVVEAVAPAAEEAPAEEAAIDASDTGYIIICTALVLMMTLPGLALFYGGMVRRKNIIATVTQSVAVTCLIGVIWYLVGYSIAFTELADATLNQFFGGFDKVLLNGVTATSASGTLPEFVWISYQMTFAIITPALITGAFAERVKLSGMLLFMALWSVLVYAPICHQVWGGGIMSQWGVLDFAGGAVVHLNAGVAGLVAAIFLGSRKGYGTEVMHPNNLVFVLIGASLLFVGWIGFNAGSALSPNSTAGVALVNTLLATCAAGLSWKIVEWIFRSKPSLLGVLSGLIAGLVGITPAAGFVNPTGALIIGLVCGPVCYFSAVYLKKLLRYDDSLDAFGIHGVGGAVGAILTGLLWVDIETNAAKGSIEQMIIQAQGLGLTILWSGIGTLLILIVVKFTTGLRVSEKEEDEGLDVSLHDEVLH